jgi:uncharacterized protein YcaQ
MEGSGSRGWWDLKIVKRVATALWSAGVLAIRERRNFQRVYDLTERVIPEKWRRRPVARDDALEMLLGQALDGHGWAAAGTLAQTWRFRNAREEIRQALERMTAKDVVRPCALVAEDGRCIPGWIRPRDLELADRLARMRPRRDRGVLLSPFDPVLWDRGRVRQLFGFDQVLEIFKPAARRVYGYYCLPVLAGDRLVARVDLKADRKTRKLHLLSARFERRDDRGKHCAADREALRSALARYAGAVQLHLDGRPV